MYRMKVVVQVVVEVKADTQNDAWQRLHAVKHSLRWSLSQSKKMQGIRKEQETFAKIVDAKTDVILSEESS